MAAMTPGSAVRLADDRMDHMDADMDALQAATDALPDTVGLTALEHRCVRVSVLIRAVSPPPQPSPNLIIM